LCDRDHACDPEGASGYGCRVTRVRADNLLAERGLAASRTAAAASIRAGQVRLGSDGKTVEKPGQLLAEDAELSVDDSKPLASRGGIKLDNALSALPIEVQGKLCLDVGASTGGFTDCLLRRGASRVIALDVGRGQLDWGLRQDERVEVMERANARHLSPGDLPFAPKLVTIDVSFISLSKLLAPVVAVADERFDLLALVKPQFELGPERVGKGGVVRDAESRRQALLFAAAAAGHAGLAVRGFAASGLPGPKGNRETFIWCDREGPGLEDLEAAVREVEP
jgi:23S rRNA (cytidine1920-2'-O)/16S rRNA (cytidine1409-2'-O)-methyltransferase